VAEQPQYDCGKAEQGGVPGASDTLAGIPELVLSILDGPVDVNTLVSIIGVGAACGLDAAALYGIWKGDGAALLPGIEVVVSCRR
jgi:hypothetical protein